MSGVKYIIRYKMRGWHKWCYSIRIEDDATYSTGKENGPTTKRMTLKEARRNVIKIKKIRRGKSNDIEEIQIIEEETNKIIESEWKYEEVSRFDLMEL